MTDRQDRRLRAGRYVAQPTGYRAFMPASMPPEPPLEFDGAMQVLLSRADQALGRLDGAIQTLPDADMFVFMYVRKEAVLSSQIEGMQSSLHDVLAAEAELASADTPRDVGEVLNHVRAVNLGMRLLPTLPVSVRLVRELHRELLTGVRGQERSPGEPRTSQNWIGAGGVSLSEASFVPPPPHAVAAALGELERFIHAEDDLPVLVKIGLAHAQFETIHPFLDGNGRVGRLLIALLLAERGVLLRPVLYLSHYFRQHRSAYYEALQATRDSGDWEGWITFFLRAVGEVAVEATGTARAIVDLRERHRLAIGNDLGRSAASGLRVLESLYRRPIVSVADVRAVTGTTYQAANDVVARLEGIGVLHEITGQVRHRRFRYDDYVDLFAEDRRLIPNQKPIV
ncbi:MAG: Fic family protein [Gemmatimonadaceae bacterium]|nr:Fic family protein [Gemmatimonadaceae bacterium]